MKIINKYGPCRGLTIYRRGRLNVELWYCPRNYDIVEHKHPSQLIELIFLFGWTVFHRREKKSDVMQSADAKFPFNFLRNYTVPMGWFHSFNTGHLPLIFINVERWKEGVKITSAADDFQVC